MALPTYNPAAASPSFFDGVKAAAARELERARDRFWPAVKKGFEIYSNTVTGPLLGPSKKAAAVAEKPVKSVLAGFKIGGVLLVLVAAFMVFVYVQPFIPKPSK